jgi:membrane protease YdiL (CAAX protease family)
VTRTTRVEVTVLALCIGAFCLAMGLREVLNIWIGTGSAAVISIVLLRRLPSPPSLQASDDLFRSGIAGLLVGLVMSIATWVLYPISVDFVPAIGVEVPKLYGLLRQVPGPVWAFPVLVLVVAAEELVWRGLAIDLFSKSFGASGGLRSRLGRPARADPWASRAPDRPSDVGPAGLRAVPGRVVATPQWR